MKMIIRRRTAILVDARSFDPSDRKCFGFIGLSSACVRNQNASFPYATDRRLKVRDLGRRKRSKCWPFRQVVAGIQPRPPSMNTILEAAESQSLTKHAFVSPEPGESLAATGMRPFDGCSSNIIGWPKALPPVSAAWSVHKASRHELPKRQMRSSCGAPADKDRPVMRRPPLAGFRWPPGQTLICT